MAVLSDIIALLDRWDVWRAIRANADRVPALEARVAEIETKLSGLWPPDVCRHCGERALRLDYSRPLDRGAGTAQRWGCRSCKNDEWRTVR